MKVAVKEQIQLLDFLIHALDSPSRNSVRKMLKYDRIKVGEQIVTRPDLLLEPGQLVTIGPASKVERVTKEKSPYSFHVQYEDEAIIVVEKPSGLLSISTESEKAETMHALLYSYMQAHEGGRVYLVHRLDRDVSGLMVFAKTSEAKTNLQLNWDAAEKRYSALVFGSPPTPKGRIELWIEEEAAHKMHVTRQSESSKLCITEYQTIKEMKGYTLLDITLLTGRRHQIRLSLAHIGCPIAGDRVYGVAIPGRREILLLAYSLRFRHPSTGKMVSYTIPIPNAYKTPPKSLNPQPGSKPDKANRSHNHTKGKTSKQRGNKNRPS